MSDQSDELVQQVAQAPDELIDELISMFSDPELATENMAGMRELVEAECLQIEDRDGALLMLALLERLIDEPAQTKSKTSAMLTITVYLCGAPICALLNQMQAVDEQDLLASRLRDSINKIQPGLNWYLSKKSRLEKKKEDIEKAARALNQLRKNNSRSITLKEIANHLEKIKEPMALQSDATWLKRVGRLRKAPIVAQADELLRK